MEITEEQYARIKDSLPMQRRNVRLNNLQVLNAILYVAELGCKWRGLPKRFGRWHSIWGDRYGKLTDPFGHVWGIATHVEDVAPAELEKRAKESMAKMAAGQAG